MSNALIKNTYSKGVVIPKSKSLQECVPTTPSKRLPNNQDNWKQLSKVIGYIS